ncbi:MAG: hypothetical protein D3914_12870, partial [Candidatus Electrothrix sp. LOE2]|nr:hypothetical protein [Candidatus Electrothrix sp. LOE2]
MNAQSKYIRKLVPGKGSGGDCTGNFLWRMLVAVFLAMLLPIAAQAANPDPTGKLRIEIISAYNLVVDSNVTSPPTYAPKAATLGARICNDDPDKAINDVHAYIGNYIDGTNDTPGTYPVFDSTGDSRSWLANTGLYSLTHESGSFTSNSDASRAWVGTLQPGECKTEYWIISYPQCVNLAGGVAQSPPCDESITGGVKGDDDLSLDYDVWANGYYDADSSGDKSGGDTYLAADDTRSLTLRNEISAAANKIWPNGDNKVPDEY